MYPTDSRTRHSAAFILCVGPAAGKCACVGRAWHTPPRRRVSRLCLAGRMAGRAACAQRMALLGRSSD